MLVMNLAIKVKQKATKRGENGDRSACEWSLTLVKTGYKRRDQEDGKEKMWE